MAEADAGTDPSPTVCRPPSTLAGPARRAPLLVVCLSLLAYGYFVYRGPHHNPDSRLALTYSLVERHALDIDPYANMTLDRAFAGGHYYTDKAPGVSFALAPLYAGLRTILPPALVDFGTPDQPDRFVVRYLLTFLGIGVPAALFNAFLFSWLGHFEPRVSPRLAVTLGYALGSPAYPFVVSAFGHVPAGMALAGALMLVWLPRSAQHAARSALPLPHGRLIAAGLLLGLAPALEYPAALGSLALGALAVWPAADRRATLGALAAGAAAPLLLLGAYHWAVFGSPLSVGYAHLAPGTDYVAAQATGLLGVNWPDASVAAALLVGAHRGLLVFAPWLALAVPGGLLLWRRRGPKPSAKCNVQSAKWTKLRLTPWLWRRPGSRFQGQGAKTVDLGRLPRPGDSHWLHGRRALVLAGMGTFGALLLVNSGYVFWDGGASWGPRHLVPALPFLAILSLPAAARWPRLAWALAGASMAMTLAGVATGSLPDSEVHAPLTDLVWPRVLAGCVTNNWGQVAGLLGWRGLVPLAALEALVVAWAVGWRRSAGALVVAGWCLAAIARLNRNYLEYSEGYYLYLGSRLAAGARLYADTASTQPPLLPQLVGALWRIQPDIWLPRLLAIGCYAVAALLAGRVAARLTPVPWSGPLAIGLAALLPLGAGAPQVLDANAVLAPLAAAVALLWAHVSAAERRGDGAWLPAAAAGMLAAFGLATKLTFAPFAVAPLLAVLGGLLVRRFTRGRERRGLKAPGYTSKAGSSRLQFVPPRPATFRGLRASSRAPYEICVSNPVVSRCPRERASNTELGPQNSLGPGVPPPAQNRPLNRALAVYLLALATGLGAQVVYWQVASGPNSADAVFGELESPLHPAGALLAIFQLIYLEGIPLALAVAGWWSLYRRQCEQGLLSFGFAAATLPLFAVHQGTFVGVARPAEPFIAAFAVAGLYAAGRRLYAAAQPAWWRRAALGLAGALAILTPGAWSAETLLETRTVAPEVVLAPLQAAAVPGQPLLAPPYYAALAGRTMLFDYPDWTVWGMRAAAGAPRERQLAAAAAGLLRDRQIPVVAADFRLAYIGPIAGALPRHYSAAGNDGDDPARAVTFWVPK